MSILYNNFEKLIMKNNLLFITSHFFDDRTFINLKIDLLLNDY